MEKDEFTRVITALSAHTVSPALTIDEAVGSLTPAELVSFLSNQLTNAEATLDLHQSEMRILSQLLAEAHDIKSKMLDRRMKDESNLRTLEAQFAAAKRAQAEAAALEGFQPDLNNPELVKLIDILHSWEHYEKLDDFQVEDITFTLDRWLRTKDQSADAMNVFTRGVINANDTGMGKTVETIAFLYVMQQINPKATVVWFTGIPLVKETAPEAVNKWGFNLFPVIGSLQDKLAMINTMKTMPFPMSLILNYEALNNTQLMEAIGNDVDFMIIDEVHKLRGGANQKPTQIFLNAKAFKLRTNAWPLMLSGSIINNHQKELWAFLNLMDEERFPSLADFSTLIQTGIMTEKEIIKILAPSMFRRTKREVSMKLPEKEFKHHRIPLTDRVRCNAYNGFAESMSAWMETKLGDNVNITLGNMLERMIRLRACLVYPETMKVKEHIVDPINGEPMQVEHEVKLGQPEKLDYVCSLANELLLEGNQVVIATASFNAPLNYIGGTSPDGTPRLIGTSEKLYGANTKIAGDIAERFRAGETQVILTNMKAGGVGLNLHESDEWPGGASHMILVDDWYNPEAVRQMTDRIWRRGANKTRVIIHIIQFEDTIDEVIEAIRESKLHVNGQIMESQALRAGDWKKLLQKALAPK